MRQYSSSLCLIVQRARYVDLHTSYVPICAAESFRSNFTASGTKGENANHDRNADQNPNHDLSESLVRELLLDDDEGVSLTSESCANIDF